MTRKTAYAKAVLAIAFARLVLRFSDPLIVRLLGAAAFAAKWLGASRESLETLGEVEAIFVKRGEGARIVRRMFHDGDPRRLRMIVRGFFLTLLILL